MPLSSEEKIFKTKAERTEFVSEYDDDEVDIDTGNYEYGWEFWEEEI